MAPGTNGFALDGLRNASAAASARGTPGVANG
jgi:hypothetical protein